MKCFSVAVTQHVDGTARLAFVGGGGRAYHVDHVEADRVVWLASTLLEWSLQGLLFDEHGGMSKKARTDFIRIARACGDGVVVRKGF